jgi:hypothetical protein
MVSYPQERMLNRLIRPRSALSLTDDKGRGLGFCLAHEFSLNSEVESVPNNLSRGF